MNFRKGEKVRMVCGRYFYNKGDTGKVIRNNPHNNTKYVTVLFDRDSVMGGLKIHVLKIHCKRLSKVGLL